MVAQERIGLKNVPSVTQILGTISNPKIDEWKESIGLQEAKRLAKEGREFGKAVHADIHNYFTKGELVSTDEKVLAQVGVVIEWSKQKVASWVCFEHMAFNDTLPYCARIDAVAELKTGELVIVDFKTGKYNSETNELQMIAYLNCTRYDKYLVDPTKINRAILLFPRLGNCEEVVQPRDTRLWTIFNSVYSVWKWRTNKTGQFGLRA